VRSEISGRELAAAICLNVASPLLLHVPSALALLLHQAAWVPLLPSALVSFLPLLLAIRFLRGRPLAIALASSLGRPLTILFCLTLGLFAVFVACLDLRLVSDFATQIMLPDTPVWFIGLLFATVGWWAGGTATVRTARLGLLILIIALFALLFIAVSLLGELRWENLRPFGISRTAELWRASALVAGWYLESVVLVPWASSLAPGVSLRHVAAGVLLILLFTLVLMLLCLTVFGPVLTGLMTYPTYYLAQFTTVGEFFERIDLVLVTIWLWMMGIKLSISIHTAAICCRVIRPASLRLHASLAAAAAYGAMNVWGRATDLFRFELEYWTWLSGGVVLVVCGLMLVGLIRRTPS
jgi:spore germination protein KB